MISLKPKFVQKVGLINYCEMLLQEKCNKIKTEDRPLDSERISDLEECVFNGVQE